MSEEYYSTVSAGPASSIASDVAQAAGLSAASVAAGCAALAAGILARLAEVADEGSRRLAQDAGSLALPNAELARAQWIARAVTVDPRLSLLSSAVLANDCTAWNQTVGHLASPDAAVAARASADLDRLVAGGLDRLRPAGRNVLLEAVRGSLVDCGFQGIEHRLTPDGRVAIRARRRGVTAIIDLDSDGGQLNADLVGCSGMGCEAARHEFLGALARRGFVATVHTRRLHGDPRGGALLHRTERIFAATGTAGSARLVPRLTGSHGHV